MAGTKLTDAELEDRIEEAYTLRYVQQPRMTQKQYVEYCKEKYNDKSEQTYCGYFTKAKEVLEKRWNERLDNLLDPAIDELTRLLASEQEKVRQRAVDQIIEYAGKKVKKIEQDITSNGETIKVNFGRD